MQVVYALEDLPETINKSLFIAGPTRRNEDGLDWRKDTLQILDDIGFDGTVFVPEPRSGEWHNEYDDQVEWEDSALNAADCILFWIPRDLKTMPGFTTNQEAGQWFNSGKCVLGYPEDAEKVRYQHHWAEKLNIPISTNLTDTLRTAIEFIGVGADRVGGEREVPLYIWRTPAFQTWYKSLTDAGNRLDHAKVLFNFRPGNKAFVFMWALHADVYVASENRHKTNEFVLARTDISSVLLWQLKEPLLTSEVVLVKEFRTPARTPSGFIYELIGGSSNNDDDPKTVAVEEIFEETGMHLLPERLRYHGSRQLAGTLSSHHAQLFSAELTDEEMEWFRSQKDVVHGNAEDSERTFIEVVTLETILKEQLTDWTTLGQVMQVINGNEM